MLTFYTISIGFNSNLPFETLKRYKVYFIRPFVDEGHSQIMFYTFKLQQSTKFAS
jgi:hypothetical protein